MSHSIKTLSWTGGLLFISNGHFCEMMSLSMEQSRHFETEALSSLSPNGSHCVTYEKSDGVVRVRRVAFREWRLGDTVFSCQGLPSSPPLHFAWSPDGALLAVQSADGSTSTYQVARGRVYQPGQQRCLYRSERPFADAQAMVFSPSGKRLAVAGSTSGVVLWDTTNSEHVYRALPTHQVTSIAWSPDERFLALGGDDSIAIYLTRSGRLLHEWAHTTVVTALAWSPTGERLMSGDAAGTLLMWDMSGAEKDAWKALGSAVPSMEAQVEACTWSPDGQQCAVLSRENQLEIFTR